MDFTLSALVSSFSNTLAVPCNFPLITLSSKRRQLAPPSKETLPRHPLNGREDTSTNSYRAISSSSFKKNIRAKDVKTDDNDDDDDETMSTVSTSTSTDVSMDDDCCTTDFTDGPTTGRRMNCTRMTVSFAFPVVTQVYTRQTTASEDKYYLHYTDADYLDFKIGFITGKDRTRKVYFARDVISEVASVPAVPNHMKQVFYYSESELQGFLDDFVQSLNRRV